MRRRALVLVATMAAAMVLGAGVALAASVGEVEPNDSIAQAQNLDGSFSLDFDPNIGNIDTNTSETLPHATVNGTGNSTQDYYSFTVSQAGDGVILDVDEGIFCAPEGCQGFDSVVVLYDSSGQELAFNDDARTEWGQGGGNGSYLEYTFDTPGTYYVAVGEEDRSLPISSGVIYQLQVSLGELPEQPYICLGQSSTIEAKPGRSVNGTRGDDVIVGTEGPDTINGRGGNDAICARDGTNTVKGGDGDDQIISDSGNDSLSGGAGLDGVSGGEGNNQLSGGPGNDTVVGGEGNDRIMGDRGSDGLVGYGGDDTLNGGLGPDYINGGEGTDKCSLGEIGREECELAFGPNVNP